MAYRIGEVARRVGMTAEGLRFYERAGLVRPLRRTPGGYRLYGEEQIDALRFVRAAQEMGFSLGEIRELLQLRRGTEGCRIVHDRLLGKLERVRQRIRLLRAFERQLETAVARCERRLDSGDDARCPVLEELGRGFDGTAMAGPSGPPARSGKSRADADSARAGGAGAAARTPSEHERRERA